MATTEFYGARRPQIPEDVQHAIEVLVLWALHGCTTGLYGPQPPSKLCKMIETVAVYLGFERFERCEELGRAVAAVVKEITEAD